MDALKLYCVTACIDSAERLFHYFTPRNEKLHTNAPTYIIIHASLCGHFPNTLFISA